MGIITDTSFIQLARQFFMAVSGELDEYTTRKGVILTESQSQVSLLTPSHIQYAKYGRKAGKKPPLDPIIKWIRAKNIDVGIRGEMGTAFAIQNSIGEMGTIKGRKNDNPPNALEKAIEKNLVEFGTELAGIITIRIEDEVNKIYKKSFPEKTVFKI